MKRIKSKLAIILMMMLIFTSFEFVGVFAGDEIPAETPEAVEEAQDVVPAESTDAPAVTEEATDPEVEEVVDEVDTDAPAITNLGGEGEGGDDPDESDIVNALSFTVDKNDLQLLSGNKCVVLRWKKKTIEGVDPASIKYYVYEGDTLVASSDMGNIKPYNYIAGRLTGDYLKCEFAQPVSTEDSLKTYQYKIQAKVGDIEGPIVASNERAPVRTIAYKFKVKSGTKLKKHGGDGPKTYKLKAGQTLYCYGFGGGGCYMFKVRDSKGGESIFYCAKIRAKKPKAIYRTDWDYTREEAELFLNQRGVSSKTNTYLWTSSYTQHFYYMEGKAGAWKCVDDWHCATGKASSPTPTGMWNTRTIKRKVKKHHGIKWWLPFSEWNSVHGQRKGWKFGKPASHGCVRNPIKKAEWMYKRTSKKTGLLIY